MGPETLHWGDVSQDSTMADSRDNILHPNQDSAPEDFPCAPPQWTREAALQVAEQCDLELSSDHWEVVRAIQEYYVRNDQNIKVRELLDALNEKFHNRGGLKYLYRLLPGGPVAQGCKLAGLQPPAGSIDKGFGSVQ